MESASMICFALLAHKNQRALLQQIKNIRKYNGPDVKIVMYNGSSDPDFGKQACKKANVMYCPYSSPLKWGKTARFHYDVMRWLEEKKVSYDYLVILDYDVLFVNHGFKDLLKKEMKGYDCIMKVIRHETDPKTSVWIPGKTMWKDWRRWKPFFGGSGFYGTFNPMQVYRHRIIKRMLHRIDRPKLHWLLRTSRVFALDEMIYITLAKRCGAKCKEYPQRSVQYLRFGPRLTLQEAKRAKKDPNVLFVHPVKDTRVWNWICRQWR